MNTAIQTAIATLKDRRNIRNRDAIRDAASVVVAARAELTERVVVPVTADEMTDPAWADIIAGSWNSCVCGDAGCHAQFNRIIGPELRTTLADGQKVIVEPGKTVFVRLAGTDQLLQTFHVDKDNDVVSIQTAGGGPGGGYSLSGMREAIGGVPAEQRTFRAPGADGLLVVVSRLDSIDEDGKLTITLDADVEQFEVRTALVDGDTVVVEPGKKVYLRKKGAGDLDCLRAISVDAEQQSVTFEDDPFDPMAGLAAVFGGGPQVFGLTDLAQQFIPLAPEKRVLTASDDRGLPLPLLRLESVGVVDPKVTLVLDTDIEAYEPPADALANRPQVHVLSLSDLDGTFGGPEGDAEAAAEEGGEATKH